MPTIPCENWVCGCQADWPVENLSAERPDSPSFLAISWPRPPRRWGESFSSEGCLFWCYSDVSQVDADICALAQEALCGGDNGGGTDGGNNGGGGGGPGGVSYASAAQSCSVDCPSGDTFTYSLPAGYARSTISQAAADLFAQNECWRLANLYRFCFNDAKLPAGCNNEPYGFQLTMSGGLEPYSFTVDPAELPNGMTFVSGSFFGTPSTAGAYPMTIVVTDSSTPPRVISKLFTLYIAEITTANPMPIGNIGSVYSQLLTETGAPLDHYWELGSGALPDGLTLNPLLGTISGTPTESGTFTFEIKLMEP